MKAFFLFLTLFVLVGATAVKTVAQCDRSSISPIRCGYYDEGYQDGTNDARANLNNDYRRYRSKFENQYVDFYRQGYEAGFRASGTPPVYPPTYPPGGGSGTGSISWNGRVDNRVNIIIQGREFRNVDVTNSGFRPGQQFMNGSLPRRATTVTVNKLNGRGTATVVQQPNRSNGFTAIVQVSDPGGSDDDYRLNIAWQSNLVEEAYASGRVSWRGRVDQKAHIIISGDFVETQNIEGNGATNVRHEMSGYLAMRPGNVTARKRDGRGSVTVLQHPSRENDYTSVIQIFDPSSGAENYHVEISW